jgi:predicted RNA polymerase sigma factor
MKLIFIQTQREHGMNRHLDHNNAQPIHDEGCHPALTQDAQVALPLREVCDLTTEEIARVPHHAFQSGATHPARQKKIRDARIAYEVPPHKEDLASEEIRRRGQEMFKQA